MTTAIETAAHGLEARFGTVQGPARTAGSTMAQIRPESPVAAAITPHLVRIQPGTTDQNTIPLGQALAGIARLGLRDRGG
jgi:hypothetical protein